MYYAAMLPSHFRFLYGIDENNTAGRLLSYLILYVICNITLILQENSPLIWSMQTLKKQKASKKIVPFFVGIYAVF